MSNDPHNPYGQMPPIEQSPPTQYSPPPLAQNRQAYGQPLYAGPPVYLHPAKKSSLRWLWITLSIVGGLLVLACAGCAVAGALGFTFLAQTLAPQVTAQQYYQAIEQQDYATAYSFMTSDASITVGGQAIPLTQEAIFATTAKALDRTAGTVSGFDAGVPGSDTSRVTVTVTRGSRSYEVHLTLVKVDKTWKIQSADGI
jgi:hypothetical protein